MSYHPIFTIITHKRNDWRCTDKMEQLKISDGFDDIVAELNTIIIALGNKDVFSNSTQDVCISLIKVREQLKKLSKEIER